MIARPFIKYAGGKTKLLPQIMKLIPDRFSAYHEPFVGGGALFFELYRAGLLAGRTRFLNDTNRELICAYDAVREDVADLIVRLREYQNTPQAFARARVQLGLSYAERAARFIYLNKTAFNGLWRVNKSGAFNVPFGHYANPKICDHENLIACNVALRDVCISRVDFEDAAECARAGDFVYFDPPYLPASPTSSFRSYGPEHFGIDEHVRLRDVALRLKEGGVSVLISQAAGPIIWELYSRKGFKITKVEAPRSVSADGSKRGMVKEFLIT